NSQLNAICSQLLTQDDLNVPKHLIENTLKDDVLTEITISQATSSLRIFATKQIYLSKITPLLHDFGFNIIDEVTYNIEHEKNLIYINRFNLAVEDKEKLIASKSNIETIISNALMQKNFSQCKLFSLVFFENFSIREVMLLRSFIEYINQAVIAINHDSILFALISYHKLSKYFIEYFNIKFDPNLKKREEKLKKISQAIEDEIKIVPNITDDKILKLTYAALQSMLRTNYFLGHESIAFKIDTKSFSENLKGLQPNIETFVYHPDFSGLHLRMSRVSRGGLRWSERHEDYRQEIKSLMITQEGKNSIIIPDGAKGGFVIHKNKSEITKEVFQDIYRRFINNLLDLVDNMDTGKIVKNPDIVAYDGDDAYFVVAADKGTASMSDVANSIAVERNFWLGDAFASGGSNGFGHKELGITAKGSLVSSKRFFLEEGIDINKESITIVGIGSMNGDVFGNGLLDSQAFKLLVAISHKEIFVDPDPIPLVAFEERQRLFVAKNGSWNAYNSALISKGGGVFLRSQKSIELSSEIKNMIKTTRKTLSGEELARAFLCMNVDMLFNGGVGTYVKSSDESNLDLGDKQNEAVRVDASELKAKVVCEGGNLGFTQKARIEYALLGGKINLDGIDNAAGVNTSDHEVNLKILLNSIVSKGLLNAQESKQLLSSLTEQVVNTVLWNNYLQAVAISRDEALSKLFLNDFIITIEILESNITAFNRRDLFIPKNENMHEIITSKNTIVRPILSFMISYSKIFIKELLLRSQLTQELFTLEYLFKYFPKSFISAYEHEIKGHPLRDEIIATVIADILINLQGSTFISDYKKLGEERFLIKIKSYLISNQLFGANDIRHEIYRNDYKLDIKTQYKLLSDIEHTLNFSTRWMVKYLDNSQIDAVHILDYKQPLFELLKRINPKDPKNYLDESEDFNHFFNHLEYLRFAISTIIIKEETHHSFENVAELFYKVVNEFKILNIITTLDTIEILSKNEIKLKHQLLQFIEFIVVHFTQNILEFQRINESSEVAFASYIANDEEGFKQIKSEIDNFTSKEQKDIKDIAVTVNQLMSSAM
ncbi:MAG: NAD-glutamate dehydrogenase, partial [Campylobacterota bacterium]|nr:NAD-glutamate dehydrogenase [Campylobacterota bacterium]